MILPTANYVLDTHGKKSFVQIDARDWEKFVEDYKKIELKIAVKNKLKIAFTEIHQIKNGKSL